MAATRATVELPASGERSPVFSVVVPTYNRARTLPRAMRAVLSQSFQDLELIVIDDGSSDDTPSIVSSMRDPRIRYRRQQNLGRSAARNNGAAVAKGRYLTFLDSDDEVDPGWLSTLLSLLCGEGVGVACCGALMLLERPDSSVWRREVITPHQLGPVFESAYGLFLAGTFAMELSLFHAIGGYEQTIGFSENTELALRLIPHCREKGLSIATTHQQFVLIHSQRGTGDELNRLTAAEFMLRRHGAQYRRHSPTSFANYHAIAGVHAARLGNLGAARRHLVSAVVAAPLKWRQWARLALAFVPPLARMYWSNGHADSPSSHSVVAPDEEVPTT